MHPHWPVEPPGYIFLAAAFEKFGTERFGDEWTGRERVTGRALRVLPEIDSATSDDLDNGFSYLSWARPDRAAALVRPGTWLDTILGRARRGWQFSDEDWAIATEASRRMFELDEPAFRRGAGIRQEMGALAFSGHLVTYARPVRGGAMIAISPEAWNTEHLFGRFADCQISLSAPFGALRQVTDSCWIFVASGSPEEALRSPISTPDDQAYRSPYLQCMNELTEEMGITRRYQPKKIEIESLLKKKFEKAKLKPTENLLKVGATLMRDPQSQAGKGRKDLA
jgi:hypothetical protein